MKSTASRVILCVRFSDTNGCSKMLWSFMRTQLNEGIIMMNPTMRLMAKTAAARRQKVLFLLILMIPLKYSMTVEANTVPSVL